MDFNTINNIPDDSSKAIKQKQLEEIINNLKSLDLFAIATKMKNVDIKVYTGRSLTADEYYSSGLNARVFDEVEQALESSSLIFLTAAFRMGKTSISRTWKAKNSEARYFLDTMANESFLDDADAEYLNASSEVFLDEFNPTQGNVQMVKTLINEGKKVIISVLSLTFYNNLKQGFANLSDQYSEIFITPSSNVDISNYVLRTLKLDPENENEKQFAELITELSGGSALIANVICYRFWTKYNFTEGDIQSDTMYDQIYDVLRATKQAVTSQLDGWDYIRTETPDYLKHLIPDPLAQYIV
jgi:hypothetical protein